MRGDVFRVLKNVLRRKVKTQSQSIDFNPTLTFDEIREEKGDIILRKLYFQKLERKRRI